jgi:isoleucyl-tRNA synthetase
MTYEPLPETDANELEVDVLRLWETEGLFRQTVAATANGEPFVFYEGPPTANGKPGVHHVFARTIKDLICRYRSMTGRAVTRIAGWDTHGLPVEISVEQELEINGKADIEAFGIAEFNRRCRESVFRYKVDWEQLSNRIGYWLDYDRPYVTYTSEYIETVWWLLAELWKKGLLYEGRKVLPYCPRCGTALSSHELAMGYADHRSPSIYTKFRIVDPSGSDTRRALLVWTTTPWTLPSNVAIAVNPEFEYVELEVNGEHLIVERTIAEVKTIPGLGDDPLGSYPVRATWSGQQLLGTKYEQLMDAVDVDSSTAFRVVRGDFVTREEGTGLVHLAPAFGADDYDTVVRENMPFVNPVDESGRFSATRWDDINGKTVFEANDRIAARLESAGKLAGRYEPAGYEHTYPFCWRCDSPLIYYARRSWFVRTTAFSDRMVAFNRDVRWQPPEVGEGRFGEWLENNVDWALSRDRYWGTPLPVWVCDREESHKTVIGSYELLADRWGMKLDGDFDPHRPFIDDVTFSCEQCDGTMRRVPAVIDAWFDSGAMPYAQWHYPFENSQEFERHFPADYICEGLDQTRGWFYSLLAIAAGVSEQPAYRNVIVNGLVLDADGRKMSKRLGNVVDPWEAVREFGADAVRLYLVGSGQVWLARRFDPKTIPEVSAGFLNQLRNVYKFFQTYAHDWRPDNDHASGQQAFVDRWMLSRLDELTVEVNEAWQAYDVRTGVRRLMEFCDVDLSNWYVRLNRARFWAPDSVADPKALATLYTTLVTLVRMVAPAAPFLSDLIHRQLTGTSVHLASFPQPSGDADLTLNQSMAVTRRLVTLARTARETASIRGRQPLGAMQVAVPASARGAELDACLGILQRELNVKRVEVVESDARLVTLKAKPNFRSLGKVYQAETPQAAAAAETLTAAQLRQLEEGQSVSVKVNGTRFAYRPEDIVVVREVNTDWVVQSDGPYVVALDPTITDDLRQEGLARELVNRIQNLRKEAGYVYTTRIILGLTGARSVLDAAGRHRDYIAGETLARRFEVGADVTNADLTKRVDMDGEAVVVSMVRVERGNDDMMGLSTRDEEE